MRVIRWIRRNPLLIAVGAFVVGTVPQWISAVWGLFMTEPLVAWLIKHGVPHIGFSPWWVTGPVGLLMFATVVLIQLKVPFITKKRQQELQARHASAVAENKAESFSNPFQTTTIKRNALGEIIETISHPNTAPDPQLAQLRFQLAEKITKRERIRDTPNSPGFDMDAARARNERSIIELRNEIEHLENKSFATQNVSLRPIQIRDSLDGFIRDADTILRDWSEATHAVAIHAATERSLDWIALVTEFVKRHFDVDHFDRLQDFGNAVTANDRYHITFNLEQSRIRWQQHAIAQELAHKRQILIYFRKDIR